MSVGKRHLHVNGSMVTKVWLSGTRRGEVNEARSSGGKKRTAARWKKPGMEKEMGEISFRFDSDFCLSLTSIELFLFLAAPQITIF